MTRRSDPTAPGILRTACGGCGARYENDAWDRLTAVRTLDASDVRLHVLIWPSERRIEVRACARCGRELARLATQARDDAREKAS